MGSSVGLDATIPAAELLPRVNESQSGAITDSLYGIAVGGDTDGIYGDGTAAADDSTRASASAGQAVVIVTQGRCPARVNGSGTAIAVGDPLGSSTGGGTEGVLIIATATSPVIARALQPSTGAADIIAVDVQREGSIT